MTQVQTLQGVTHCVSEQQGIPHNLNHLLKVADESAKSYGSASKGCTSTVLLPFQEGEALHKGGCVRDAPDNQERINEKATNIYLAACRL